MMTPGPKKCIWRPDLQIIREVLLFEKIAATTCSYSITLKTGDDQYDPWSQVFRNHLQRCETAKANNLKPFDYVQYLLEEIPKHMDDKDCSFWEDLLPWSEKLPSEIRKA